jgi:transcriptional regulator with XRE-family HTH domain/tetratricopeptide (TPR) repeat protein
VSGRTSAPARLPDDAWRNAHMLRAWRTRDFRAVFLLACQLGLTPESIAANTGLPRDLVVNVMKDNTKLDNATMVESVARGLSMPDNVREAAGLAPRVASPVPIPAPQSRAAKSDRPPASGRRDPVGVRIAMLRRARGLTQELLAERAGVSLESVRKVEHQTRTPSLAMLDALAGALDITAGELIDSSASKEQPGEKRKRPPEYLPAEIISRPDFAKACAARDLGAIFTIAVSAGFTVSHLARRCEMTPSQVSDYMAGRRTAKDIKVFERVSDRLQIPGKMLRIGSRALSLREAESGEQMTQSATIVATQVFDSGGGGLSRSTDMNGDSEVLADQISELVSWAEATNVGDGTLAYLDDATLRLARDCLTVPPFRTRERASVLVSRIFGILKEGRQRIGQTRDLYVTAGKLCAILSWVSSDLGQLAAAEAHARNGWALAEQADHNGLRALVLCAQSKNEFWNGRYASAATYARRGYDFKPPGSARILLACQEADAFQAMGSLDDARETLGRAVRTQEGIRQSDELGGIFACGTARQANYSIATYLRAGSVDGALQQVERAEAAWRDGEDWAYGTWAQVQIGAAIAYIMKGEIDGASAVLRPVLDQPAESRLATLTTRLSHDVAPLLDNPAIGKSKSAIMIREGISDYGLGHSHVRSLLAGENL